MEGGWQVSAEYFVNSTQRSICVGSLFSTWQWSGPTYNLGWLTILAFFPRTLEDATRGHRRASFEDARRHGARDESHPAIHGTRRPRDSSRRGVGREEHLKHRNNQTPNPEPQNSLKLHRKMPQLLPSYEQTLWPPFYP